jgi:hypothetical protein
MPVAYTVLWWVPAGHRPSIAEAEDRLVDLRENGPTARAFTFRSPQPPPDSPAAIEPAADDWLCPA